MIAKKSCLRYEVFMLKILLAALMIFIFASATASPKLDPLDPMVQSFYGVMMGNTLPRHVVESCGNERIQKTECYTEILPCLKSDEDLPCAVPIHSCKFYCKVRGAK